MQRMNITVRDCVRCSALKADGTQCSRRTCTYSSKCFQHTKRDAGIEIRRSNIANADLGLFATRRFRRGEVIAPYGGVVVARNVYGADPSGFGIHLNQNQVIDARSTQSGMARYANSCLRANIANGECGGNNARLTMSARYQRGSLKATRVIPAGSEIFTSYGSNF